MVFQAIQAVLYVACLDEAHRVYNHENWVVGGEWSEGDDAWKACGDLATVRFSNI